MECSKIQRQAGVKARFEAEKATLAGMEQQSATPPPVYNALPPLGMPSSSAVRLLAQPFFKIATPAPFCSQVSSTPQASIPEFCRPDIEREELEKYAENNAAILTSAPPAGTQHTLNSLKPLLRLQLLNRREELPPAPPAPTLEVKEESQDKIAPTSAKKTKKKLKKVMADD